MCYCTNTVPIGCFSPHPLKSVPFLAMRTSESTLRLEQKVWDDVMKVLPCPFQQFTSCSPVLLPTDC